MVVIETERLTKLYGKARGTEHVTFSVGAGKVFGFLCSLAAVDAWLFERRDLAG